MWGWVAGPLKARHDGDDHERGRLRAVVTNFTLVVWRPEETIARFELGVLAAHSVRLAIGRLVKIIHQIDGDGAGLDHVRSESWIVGGVGKACPRWEFDAGHGNRRRPRRQLVGVAKGRLVD